MTRLPGLRATRRTARSAKQPATPKRRRRSGALGYLPVVFVVVGLLLLWEITVKVRNLPPGILPAPSEVARTLWRERVLFLDNLGVTLTEMALGLLGGFVTGIFAAIAIVHSRFVARTFYPLIVTSQLVPFVALAPLLVIWLGFGIAPKVIIVAIGIFFPVTVNMVSGLRSADPDAVNLMRSYSASSFQIFRAIELPASLPYLHSALQIAATYSLITAVVAEWPGAQEGLGRVMITSSALARTDRVLAAVVVVTVLSLALYATARLSRRFLMPWERSLRSI
jgi:ABC-type nitrate/sulfonate/bicarbonate transport system permease component